MQNFKIVLIWIGGLILTLSAAVYQRLTGPTHPYRQKVELNGHSYSLKLIRSHGGDTPAELVLPISDTTVKAQISYRLYPKADADFVTVPFEPSHGEMKAQLPPLPPAGKYEYIVYLTDGATEIELPHQIIRFKGNVPVYWLAPHVLMMFLAMFVGNVSGLMAVFNSGNFVKTTLFTSIFFGMGGLILGPIVQLYAFGDLWTGVPFGWDLTDNKTLIAAIFWGLALWQNHRSPSRIWTIVAAVVMLAVYAIPHSMFGSELNHETGKVIQGMILPMLP